ncbi:MAG: TetR/AcrR family transcriptional regulator, partial [Anaerolineae bacterium]|nr:TetR/AcrR family transcriptional regulator [Anaerolineae bacterium]
NETTSKLIAAARRAFAQEGYAATSMEALCAEVGLTRGALYHHFGGKAGLLEAVVHQINDEIDAQLDAVWEAHPDPWAAFRASCLAYLALALEPEIQRIVLTEAPAVLGQRLRESDAHSSVDVLAEGLQQLMAAGRTRQADPQALARMLNGALIDAALWIASTEDPRRALAHAQQGFDLLLSGLASSQDGGSP